MTLQTAAAPDSMSQYLPLNALELFQLITPFQIFVTFCTMPEWYFCKTEGQEERMGKYISVGI